MIIAVRIVHTGKWRLESEAVRAEAGSQVQTREVLDVVGGAPGN